MKLKAFISANSGGDVKWLIIESDEDDTRGCFVYYYLDEETAFDTWHASLEDAFNAVSVQYGIDKANWEVLSDD